MLNEVAANLNKIPIGEVQSQVQEGNNTSTSAHRLMQQNIDKISELNLEVSTAPTAARATADAQLTLFSLRRPTTPSIVCEHPRRRKTLAW